MRIGLIAMSGVRAHDPELTRLGLTLPGFIERNKVIASLPSLGLLTLAACTPDGHEIAYHEIADLQTLPELPVAFDLVAISSFSAQIFEAYQVADHYRGLGVPVVLGGIHVTACPDEAAEHASAVVVGEGERLWPQVVRDAAAGRLRPRYEAAPGEEFDLREALIPRFDLLDPSKYNRITLQTSRGCPHRCEFCASSILLTPAYKLKPVDKVLAEIQAIKAIWPRPFLEFADDNSFVHRKHYRELMEAMIPERVRWFTEADVSVARDPELLDAMRAAGCRQVLIGLESPRSASLRGVEMKADWKLRQRPRYLEAIRAIQGRGIRVNGCFILGLDEDTPDIFGDVLAFAREAGLFDVQVTLLTAFPGTPLYRRIEADGRLLHPGDWSRCTLFDATVRPKGMSLEELRTGFHGLVRALYSERETAARRRRFREQVRAFSQRRAMDKAS